MDLDHVRSEIEHMRVQVGRQRKEILQLQRAGIRLHRLSFCCRGCWRRSTTFVHERDRLKTEEGGPTKGRVLGGRSW